LLIVQVFADEVKRSTDKKAAHMREILNSILPPRFVRFSPNSLDSNLGRQSDLQIVVLCTQTLVARQQLGVAASLASAFHS
jgi:hypothetical protein